jgi:hypothetical protein
MARAAWFLSVHAIEMLHPLRLGAGGLKSIAAYGPSCGSPRLREIIVRKRQITLLTNRTNICNYTNPVPWNG